MSTQRVVIDALEVDATFSKLLHELKVQRRYNTLFLKIDSDQKRILVADRQQLDSPRKLHDFVDDMQCYFIVYNAFMDNSDGGKQIHSEKLFLLTFMPSFAKPHEAVVYETQKGNTMEPLVKGAISLNIRSKDELLQVLQAQLRPKSGAKGRFDDNSDEDNDKDWMDN